MRTFILATAAALAMNFTVGIVGNPAAAEGPMTASQFNAKVVDKTLVAKRFGRSIRMIYRSNGTIEINTPFGLATGTWVFEGGKLCANITQGPRTGRRCGGLVDLGGGQFRGQRGIVQIAR